VKSSIVTDNVVGFGNPLACAVEEVFSSTGQTIPGEPIPQAIGESILVEAGVFTGQMDEKSPCRRLLRGSKQRHPQAWLQAVTLQSENRIT